MERLALGRALSVRVHRGKLRAVLVPQEVGHVCVSNEAFELLVFVLEVATHLEELATLVLPEVTLEVLAFESSHFYS